MTRLPLAAVAALLAASVVMQLHARTQLSREGDPFITEPITRALPEQIYQVTAVTTDIAGNVVIAGITYSSDFPTTPDAADRTCGSEGDAFVLAYSPAGELRYASCVGGPTTEMGTRVAAARDGSIWLAAETSSKVEPPGGCSDCGTTRTAIWRIVPGIPGWWQQGWLTPPGMYAHPYAAAAAQDGTVWVMAATQSPGIPTIGAWQPVFAGGSDILLARYAEGRPQPLLITYLGGSGWDTGYALATAPDGDAVLTGSTTSADFPLVRPAQPLHGGHDGYDAVVARVDASGRWLEYSTFLGGSAEEAGTVVAVDRNGTAIVLGRATGSDFPPTGPSMPRHWSRDIFIAALDAAGDLKSLALVDTALEQVPADDVGGAPVLAVPRPDGSVLMVGTYFSDNLLQGGGFLALMDEHGSAIRPPMLLDRESPSHRWVEGAAAGRRHLYLVKGEMRMSSNRHGLCILPLGGGARDRERRPPGSSDKR
jgi:hypothetical protein